MCSGVGFVGLGCFCLLWFYFVLQFVFLIVALVSLCFTVFAGCGLLVVPVLL